MEKQNDGLSNIQRVLNQLDKALDRLKRQNYFDSQQKDPLFDQIELAIETMRQWIRNYRVFKELNSFYIALSLCIKEICELVNFLAKKVVPVKGKKWTKKL